MRKEQIKSIDFIKGICALGVLLFHFEGHYTARYLSFFDHYFNGGTLVTVFFVVSGALLWYHYGDGLNLKDYAIKRWKGIYPMYYIAFIPCWLLNVWRYRSFLYEGSAFAYIYTLLGMDGYLAFNTNTYHIVGEWFLGAIILMYLLFPAIRWAFLKNKWITVVGALALYLGFYGKTVTNVMEFWTISSCLISFCLGPLFMEYRKKLISMPGILASAVGYILLNVVRIPVDSNAALHLSGVCLFILLFALGEKIMARPRLEPMFRTLSRLSYPIFLVHHVIVQVVLMIWQPVPLWQIAALMVLTVAVVLAVSKVLAVITEFVVTGCEKRRSQRT